MSSSAVIVSHPGPSVVKITLNRPQRLNALSTEQLYALTDALRTHADAHVIILEGAGDRSFCAGEDLKETLAPRTGSAEELRIAFGLLQDITRLTSSSSAIVVAAVHGFAVGGGAEIALAADFVVGGPNAKFRFPEVTLGHAVTGGISLRLSHMVGMLKAKELLIRGRTIGAQEALSIGLLTELVEDPKVRAEELALEIAKLPKAASSSLKTSLERGVSPNMESALHDEVNAASYCFARTEANNAFENFASRKKSQPKVRDINTALKTAVQKYPSKVFIRCQGQDVTFHEFDRRVAALASGLRKAGVQAGNRVLVMMKNSVEMVHTWMATSRLGAVWVPVNTDWRSLTLKNAVTAADATLAIVDDQFVELVRATGAINSDSIWTHGSGNTQDLSKLYLSQEPLEESFAATPATTSAFLYTSGTTGKSKPCILSHEYFIIQATLLMESCKLRTDDVLYCPFPLFHADATALTVIPAILLGATAALSPRFTASRFWDEIRETNATVYDFMGATLALIYKQPPSPKDQDHRVRLAWVFQSQRLLKITSGGLDIHCVLYTVAWRLVFLLFKKELLRQDPAVSCGQGTNSASRTRKTSHCLLIHRGYFNDPANTVKTYANMWLHTGDIAKVDERGNVYFIGRMKDVIRRRGENINASEVEEEFLQHPDVVIAAAFAIPSELGAGIEDDLKVVVKLRGESTIDEHALWKWSQQHMTRHQVPSVIEIVNELKQTPTGKIEKGSLRAEGGQRFTTRPARL